MISNAELLIRAAAVTALREADCAEDAIELLTGAVMAHLELCESTGEVVATDAAGMPAFGLFGRLGARDVVDELKRRDAVRRFGWR